MSLIAWYKLNGQTTNSCKISPFGNLSQTGTIAMSAQGLIGSCYIFATGSKYTASATITEKSYSISLWGRVNPQSATSSCMFFSFSNGNVGPDLYYVSGSLYWNAGDGSNNPFKNGTTIAKFPPDGNWHHITVTSDNATKIVSLYVDGVFLGTATYKNVACSSFVIGNWCQSTAYTVKDSVCDVKIYDHILSLKEVKELSRLLFLNYKFNQSFEDTTNIDPFDTTFSNLADGFAPFFHANQLKPVGTTPAYLGVSSAHSYYGTKSLKLFGDSRVYRKFNVAANKPFTFSCMVYSEKSGPHIRIELYGASHNWTGFTSNIHTGNGWELLHVTTSKTLSSAELYAFIYPNSGEIYADGLMLEEKDHPTQYAKYNRSYGVTDNSGYGNDATYGSVNNKPSSNIESIRGEYSAKFDNVQRVSGVHQRLVTVQDMCIPNKFTLSYWVKARSGSGYQIAESTYMVGWVDCCNLGPKSSYAPKFGFLYKDSAGLVYTEYDTTIFDNNWNHVTTVYDGTSLKFYENGVLKYTRASTPAFKDKYTLSKFVVGAPWQTGIYGGFTGYFDDIKLYYTALSDADVLQVFQSSLEIDNHGNVYPSSVVESNSSTTNPSYLGITKRGELKCGEIAEAFTIGDTTVLDDSGVTRIINGQWNTLVNKMEYKAAVAFTCFGTAFPTSWTSIIDITKYKTRVVFNNISNDIYCNEITEI